MIVEPLHCLNNWMRIKIDIFEWFFHILNLSNQLLNKKDWIKSVWIVLSSATISDIDLSASDKMNNLCWKFSKSQVFAVLIQWHSLQCIYMHICCGYTKTATSSLVLMMLWKPKHLSFAFYLYLSALIAADWHSYFNWPTWMIRVISV